MKFIVDARCVSKSFGGEAMVFFEEKVATGFCMIVGNVISPSMGSTNAAAIGAQSRSSLGYAINILPCP